jgi:hypothetical protein
MQIGKWSRYTELIRLSIPCNQVALLHVVPDCMPRALAEIRKLKKKKE